MEKSKRLIVMVGVPGAGKSHWIQNHKNSFEGIVKVVSRDEVRFSIIKEDEEYFSHEKEVFKEFINQINQAIEIADIIIVDATHITSNSRTKLLRAIDKKLLSECFIMAMVIKNNIDVILEQNKRRTGRTLVPECAIRNMYNSMTIPELKEGFDEIWIYKGYKYTIIEKEAD